MNDVLLTEHPYKAQPEYNSILKALDAGYTTQFGFSTVVASEIGTPLHKVRQLVSTTESPTVGMPLMDYCIAKVNRACLHTWPADACRYPSDSV